jgi:hypothetical protein
MPGWRRGRRVSTSGPEHRFSFQPAVTAAVPIDGQRDCRADSSSRSPTTSRASLRGQHWRIPASSPQGVL